MIKTTNLTKYYHKNARGILDVSLDIKKGEIFGFIGPNGAGKSTTVRTLLNFIFPTSGSATIQGLDIINDSVEIRKHVGYIPSEINLYGDMTVQDFLDYAGAYHKNDFKVKQKELIKKLELDTSRKISDLSFGNKKKVAIIQALQQEPDLIILDEPTSGLDPLMQNTFFTLIKEEQKRGATIFFSSHILSEVQRICDRVAIIKDGKIIKVEKIDDIMKARAKKVRIKTPDDIKDLTNILEYKRENGHVSFVFTGSIDQLFKILSDLKVEDLTIEEPSLEEIFMHYYDREEK
ncbi:MAG: ABC transporter ATP-binding protein [Acholeplasmataceae bacterium]